MQDKLNALVTNALIEEPRGGKYQLGDPGIMRYVK